MRSQYKPPLTNWLLLKFINYWANTIIKKIQVKNILNLLVLEDSNCLLKQNFLFDKNFFTNFLKIKNFVNFSLNNTYNLFLVLSRTFTKSIMNTNILILTYLINFNLKHFFKINIETKHFLSLTSVLKNYSNYCLKQFIFNKKNFIFKKNFLIFRLYDYNFFYNSYFLFILLNSTKNYFNKIYLFLQLYYYEQNVIKILLQDFFEKKISVFNKYISIQKGFSKKTSVFLNWHYLFSTSTQIFKFTISTIYNFFFKWNLNVFHLKKKLSISKANNYNWSFAGIVLWSWKLPILPNYINKIFFVHNGNWFFWLWVVPAMVGYKFGSFSFTWKILYKNAKLLTSFRNI